jgi:hypothetical protein
MFVPVCLSQVEEQEESVVKSQADLSVYRASHIHSDSDYDSQLCRIQELQQVQSGQNTSPLHAGVLLTQPVTVASEITVTRESHCL